MPSAIIKPCMELKRAHFDDLARAASRIGARYTRFLEPSAERDAVAAAVAAGVEARFFGGYDGAERRVCAFLADGEEPQWPVCCIEMRWNSRFASADHRDLLGALMGLGIARELLGDIVVGEGCAWLFAMGESASYIMANLESAGRAHLSLKELDEPPVMPEPEGIRVRETVASTRLDAVMAAGYSLSRENAKGMVKRGMVKLNHSVQMQPDVELNEGDLVSLRGYGRMRLEAVQGRTRKGRLAVQLFRYGGK